LPLLNPAQDDFGVADRERRAVLAANPGRFEADYEEGMITGLHLPKATARVEAEPSQIDERLGKGTSHSWPRPPDWQPTQARGSLTRPSTLSGAVLSSVLRVEILPLLGRRLT
jgi:site-specific DNA recombinase